MRTSVIFDSSVSPVPSHVALEFGSSKDPGNHEDGYQRYGPIARILLLIFFIVSAIRFKRRFLLPLILVFVLAW